MNSERNYKDSFFALLEAIDDAVIIVMPENSGVECNTAAERLTGFSRDEIAALGIGSLFGESLESAPETTCPPPDNHDRAITTVTCRKKDGGAFPAEVAVRRFGKRGRDAALYLIRDLSERRRASEENTELSAELNHFKKMAMIGRLAGGITHYYNNIFTGLMGAIDIAKQDASPQILPLLKRAENAANTASGFTRRLLTFTRTAEDSPEPADIGALIDDVEQFARLTFDRRIIITVTKKCELDAVLADPAEIHHMLLNIMANARDALAEKLDNPVSVISPSITLEADNVIASKPQPDQPGKTSNTGRYVRISATDTGIGMDDQIKSHLFEPYYTTKARGYGTGIGLSSAFAFVDATGGWFEVESTRGKGTTLTVFLPAATLHRTAVQKNTEDVLPCGTETVMVVDDDDMIRTLGVMTLEHQGYSVLSAADGTEAVETFSNHLSVVDLVVLDLFLPGMSGQEVLDRMRAVKPAIPVIITSGHDFESDRDLFKELKADDYVLKPFTIADLAYSVRNVLDRK